MSARSERLPVRRQQVELLDDGEVFLLAASWRDTAYTLNTTGRAIWDLCDGRTTRDEVVEAICTVFEVPRETAEVDVSAVLDQLVDAELVDWSPANDPSDGYDLSIPHGVIHRWVEDEMVLLQLDNERYYGLNAVGATMLSRLTTQSFDEAVASLAVDYQVDQELVRRDLRLLAENLLDAGLLQQR